MKDVTLSHRLEGLNHPEFAVRSELLGMFKYEPVADATERVVREIDQRGWDEAYEFSHLVADLPHTEESFAWLVDRLQNPSANGDANPRHVPPATHLINWFAKAPTDWIAPWLGETFDADDDAAPSGFSRLAQCDISGFKKASLRVEYAGRGEDQLLILLEECWTECLEGDDFPHAPVARMELICEALRLSAQPSQETLEQWLDVDCDWDVEWDRDSEYFRAGSALMLMKQRGAAPPVGKVLRLFDLDWDWWNELIAKTLAASPSKVTLQEILAAYPSLEWHGKLFVGEVFDRLRFPGMDVAVAGLAMTEQEDDHRVRLGHAAVLYGTAAVRGTCAEIAAEFPDDPERGLINDYLRCYDLLLGENETSTRRWLRQKAEQCERYARRQSELASLVAAANPAVRSVATSRPKTPSVVKRARPATPNPHPGVGRNDPCPCGSGSKYKKCCLKKHR